MIKRRKRLAMAVVIIGGVVVLAAIAVHTLLQGSVIASVDVGVTGNELAPLGARPHTLLYRRRVRNLAGYMAVDEPINTLFVTTQTGISRLDARTGRLLGWTWSSGPNGVVVDRPTQHVFV